MDTIHGARSCLMGSGFTDPNIGRFAYNSSSPYCSCKCSRCMPRITCCAPQEPSDFRPRFRLFEAYKEERDIIWTNASESAALLAKSPDGSTEGIVYVVHGWIEKASTSPWILPITLGWVHRGRKVILVDWRHGNQIDYFQAIANVRVVGAMIGHSILNWGIADRTLIVGFSLGAQIAGEAGRYTQLNGGGVKIKECHGLDPAGPFFDGCSLDIQLTKTDCELVQVIHTSAEDTPTMGVLSASLGSYHKAGHCDYWVNCGHTQGMCKDLKFGQLVSGAKELLLAASDGKIQAWLQTQFCSHWRAPLAYLSQLTGKCYYGAELCHDCGINPKCHGDGVVTNTLPPDGICTSDEDLDYYVKSGSYDPYC
ncbi:Inactive pancreatic lipase-related protein 1 [Halotydeus destructor]|nr:Inactive pancreatic lipase-related protein 1 [Halotydeus destructor]